ncbi:MAG: DALR anticodon-binding domain-containing protein [Myxococcales bacterium]|nr:DALR anticodon-binding domain-containing protein [Myxococcales bacterium]
MFWGSRHCTGRTGPYCLYTHARLQGFLRKLGEPDASDAEALAALGTREEMAVVARLRAWPAAVHAAAKALDPGKITGQVYELCKAFSVLYDASGHRVRELQGLRRRGLLALAKAVAQTLAVGLGLLGIETLDEM